MTLALNNYPSNIFDDGYQNITESLAQMADFLGDVNRYFVGDVIHCRLGNLQNVISRETTQCL